LNNLDDLKFDSVLACKKYVLNCTISLFFIIYLLKQTLFLGGAQEELNITLFVIGFLSVITNLIIFGRKEDFIYVRKYTLLVFLTVVVMLFLYEDFKSSTEFLFKFLYMSHFVYIFKKHNNANMFIYMADLVFVCTLLIIGLSTGYIENQTAEYAMWEKNFGGFNNPNTSSFFLFSVLATYFIFGLKNRYYLALLVTLILYIFFDIYSRTFFYGSILLVLYQLAISRKYFLSLFLNHAGKFFLFISASSFLVLVIVAVFYENLEFLKDSNINSILSNRVDLLLNGLYVRSDTISGINFIAFDNIYYELLFIYGPVVFWFYTKNLLDTWYYVIASNDQPLFLYRLCVVAILVSLIGLFEGFFTKISPLTILLIALFFINYANDKRLTPKYKTTT